MEKPKIVLTASTITESFMTHDMALLKPYVSIIPIERTTWGGQTYVQKLFSFFISVLQALKSLLRALLREHAHVVFFYFVDPEYTFPAAVLVRLLRRKLIIATGGGDATYVPDIAYGAGGNWLKRRLFSYTMRLSDSVLPFSNSSRNELLQYGKPKRIRTAYMAIDTEKFKPAVQPKKCRVVTVSYTISQVSLLQKGIAPFVQAASFLPNIEFIVAGQFIDDTFDSLKAMATPNVCFTRRFLEQAEYIELLQSAAVYVQASAHEGFGVSLAEGMACGCVPVAADRYAMPEVVGDTGYIVPFNDAAAIARAVQDALQHPEKGEVARRRIVKNFTVERRQNLLREELEFLIGRKL